jgi:tetratricopeptide (TPR) repeat protein
MSMNFRFPISPNFSITGQPISRLISGDLPAEYHQRIELLDAVFDKFEAVHEAHEQARAIVLASQQGGPSFALYLRNFGVEEFRYSDDPTERIYDFRSAQFEEMLRKNAEQAGLAFLSLRGGNDRLDEFLGHTRPVFTGRSENWRDLVSELIAAAKVIVIVASGVSAGLFEELQVITAMGKNNRTLVFLKPEAKTLADILNQAEQPEQIETLRASFRQFTEIYETPRVDGWKPAATESREASPDWPGAARFSELLTDSYTGKSELRAVRAAPFQILSTSELDSADHRSAREYLNKALHHLREGVRSLNLEAPLAKSVMGSQPDSNHLGLRLAHQAFGVGAAFEDYGAMLESLAGISVICTYLLTNPAAGEAHVGYAFRLLRIRNCEGVRPQDLPASQTHAYDYVREGIGNVYYALARVRRAQGETDAALAAFETSLAVREPLPSLSARKGVAATLHSLAGLLNAIGRDGEAKVLIERAISRKEAIYGTEPNEEVSASLHNLASILIKLGDLKGAEVAINRSLDMKKVVFGTTHHVSVAETALLAGWLLMEMGGRREAIPILQYAQSVFRDLAPENPQLAQIDAILAQLT